MLLLAHAITGAIIGEKINNPAVIVPLALASHFVLDWIPHWSYDVPAKFSVWGFAKTLPDILPTVLVFLVFIFAYPTMWLNIVLGVTFAILPDFLTLTNYVPPLKKIFQKFNQWHGRIQVHDEVIVGLTAQVIYISLLIMILIKLD